MSLKHKPSLLRTFASVNIAKNIANTFLAITLLIATTGVTLNKHYCMGRVKSVAINVHAAHCYDGEKEQMPCCKDTSEKLKVEEVTTVFFDFDAQPDLFEVAIIDFSLFENVEFTSDENRPHFQHYSPPLPDRDIPVLVQSFQI